ncbi:MAG: phenylacetate--CoA ligase family protein [Candidatus Aenigmatarchaeota archaeon]
MNLYDLEDLDKQGLDLEDLKDKRVDYTTDFAYENSPFYKEHLKEYNVDPSEVKSIEDLSQIPEVDAEDILQNQPPNTQDFKFRSLPKGQARRPFTTSGSTGNPKTIFYSYDDMKKMANTIKNGLKITNCKENDLFYNKFPFVGLNISCIAMEEGVNELGAESIPVSNTPYPPQREGEIIESFEPTVMLGLPSHVDSASRKFREKGYDPSEWTIDRILLAGEPVSDSRKERISEEYAAEVYEFLGTTEGGAFAWECPEHNGLHLMEESTHVDVLDEEGNKLPEGEEGKLVLTNLMPKDSKSAMPLINYNQGDLVTKYVEDSCGCGLPLEKISPPNRQSNSFIIAGVNLRPEYFEDIIYSQEELGEELNGEYQIIANYDERTGQDFLTVKLESNEWAGELAKDVSLDSEENEIPYKVGKEFLKNHEQLKDTVENVDAGRIDVEMVEEIEMPPGKPKRFIDKRKG